MAFFNYPKYFYEQSLASNFTGELIDNNEITYISFQCIWSGSPTGTLVLEGSNDGTNFISLTNMTQSLSGSSGSYVFEFIKPTFQWMRIRFQYSSGSGSISINVFGQNLSVIRG